MQARLLAPGESGLYILASSVRGSQWQGNNIPRGIIYLQYEICGIRKSGDGLKCTNGIVYGDRRYLEPVEELWVLRARSGDSSDLIYYLGLDLA